MDISDLLRNTTTSDIKPLPKFPAGTYLFVITGYETLGFQWKKSNRYGVAYVPTFKAVSCIEADDESNPELAAEQKTRLEAFGDWTAREFHFRYQNNDVQPPVMQASVAEVNFPLVETDPNGENPQIMENMIWRFYLREVDAVTGVVTQSGFCHDVLGIDHTNESVPLDELMDETVNKSFMGQIEYEISPNDPTRTYMVLKNVNAPL